MNDFCVEPFRFCEGVQPLRARLEPWMRKLLSDGDRLRTIVEAHGGPVNIQSIAPFGRNVAELLDTAKKHRIDLLPLFARKANKCLSYVEAARDLGIGVDTASHDELAQCLDIGFAPERVVCTAAVKDRKLLDLCVRHGVTVIIDNRDETDALAALVSDRKKPAHVGIRLCGFEADGRPLYSRFGIPLNEASQVAARLRDTGLVEVCGLHFHLDGYSATDRIAAIAQTLPLVGEIRRDDDDPFFLDIGGGIPMNYLEIPAQWDAWATRHDNALRGRAAPVTKHNAGLGRAVRDGELTGRVNTYPVAQPLVRGPWLDSILDAGIGAHSIADHLKEANIELRCEPGRSILDGCGMTVAEIVFRKPDSAGDWVIGVQMNRTQSRTGFAEFALDPLLVPKPGADRGPPVEAYLAGTYCTESEWLTQRRMSFPHGVAQGDLIVFPNTAGYLMHFLESRSHQFPLAKNVFVDGEGTDVVLDGIDL